MKNSSNQRWQRLTYTKTKPISRLFSVFCNSSKNSSIQRWQRLNGPISRGFFHLLQFREFSEFFNFWRIQIFSCRLDAQPKEECSACLELSSVRYWSFELANWLSNFSAESSVSSVLSDDNPIFARLLNFTLILKIDLLKKGREKKNFRKV